MANTPTNFLKIFGTIQRQRVNFCSKSDKQSKNNKSCDKTEKCFPEAPTTCCMSGCANCVWVEYAERLSEYFQDGGAKALEEIEKQITDPNMKAFLMHELRMRNIKK